MSFPFLSFPFPFLSFPFLSFSFPFLFLGVKLNSSNKHKQRHKTYIGSAFFFFIEVDNALENESS